MGLCNKIIRTVPHVVRARCTLAWLAIGAGFTGELSGRVGDYVSAAEACGRETIAQRMAEYAGDGVPEDLARRVASLHLLAPGLDIVRIAQEAKTPVPDVARTYFAVGDRFGFDWLRGAAAGVGASDNHWQRMAVAAIVEDLYGHQKDLTLRVIESGNGAPAGNGAIDAWVDQRGAAVHRMEALFADIRQAGVIDLPMLAVANRQLRSLVSG